jgi:hypothetical protein
MFQIGDQVQFTDSMGNLLGQEIPNFNCIFEGYRNGYATFRKNIAHVVKIYTYKSTTYYACSYKDTSDKEVILGFEAKYLLLLKRGVYSLDKFNVGDEVMFVDSIGNPVNILNTFALPYIYSSHIRGENINRGTVILHENKGRVIGFDESGVLVEYTDNSYRLVTLSFKEQYLRLINKSNTNVTNKTEQNRTEQSSSTGIEVQRPHPSITTATRGRAVPVSGRASRTAVTVGHLSNKAVSF